MLTSLLLANLLHGLVAWLWLAGVLRFARPFQPADQARLHALAVGLPVVVAGLHAAGENLARSPWPVVRVDRWTEWLAQLPRVFLAALVLFLAGTAAIFLFQEVIPAWVRRRRHWRAPRRQDVRIDAGVARVRKRFAEQGRAHGWRRTPRAARLEASTPMAGLVGLAQPTVLVSRGLLDRIDDEQLDAVIAHELAHSFYGGNLMLLLLWLLRALQPLSPATLVLHRTFVQRHEEACDALAARVTARPLALAEVLLLLAGSSGAQARTQTKTKTMTDNTISATEQPAQTADQLSTRLRVRGLLDRDHQQSTDAPSAFIGLLGLALAGVLWSIG